MHGNAMKKLITFPIQTNKYLDVLISASSVLRTMLLSLSQQINQESKNYSHRVFHNVFKTAYFVSNTNAVYGNKSSLSQNKVLHFSLILGQQELVLEKFHASTIKDFRISRNYPRVLDKTTRIFLQSFVPYLIYI